LGINPNKTSGVSTTETSTGPESSTVNLTVLGAPTIAKAFGTPTIQSGGTSTVILTLANTNPTLLTNASFTDTLANMSVNATVSAGGNLRGRELEQPDRRPNRAGASAVSTSRRTEIARSRS